MTHPKAPRTMSSGGQLWRSLHGDKLKEGEHRGGASERSQSGQGAILHPRW